MIGVSRGWSLDVKDCGVKAPYQLSEDERKEKGILKRMPANLDEARDISSKEAGNLSAALGEEAVSLYLDVNKVGVIHLSLCAPTDPCS